MKRILALLVCLGMILTLGACASAPAEDADPNPSSEALNESVPEQPSRPEEQEPAGAPVEPASGPAVEAVPSEWESLAEVEYKFASNLIGYYTAESAVSIGYGGEIHYINESETEWPKVKNSSLCRFGMDVVNGTVCYTCGNGGEITKSTDGGMTFEKMTNFGGSEPNQCCMMSFCDENNGIVAAAKRLAVTADGAATWTELELPFEIAAIKMESPEKFYCVGADLNLYKTADGGATWQGTPMQLPLGDAYITAPRSFTLTVDGDNMFTVFCIESGANTVKAIPPPMAGSAAPKTQFPK